jgi:hypothetical protein
MFFGFAETMLKGKEYKLDGTVCVGCGGDQPPGRQRHCKYCRGLEARPVDESASLAALSDMGVAGAGKAA